MKFDFKLILKYIITIIPWFLSSLIFRVDTKYYNSLNLPPIAPPNYLFPIVWTMLYLLIGFSIYKVFNKSSTKYKSTLIINYLANQLYTPIFFLLKNNFLSLIDCLIVLVSSIILYLETQKLDKKVAYFLIPYIVWNIFATILSIWILVLN